MYLLPTHSVSINPSSSSSSSLNDHWQRNRNTSVLWQIIQTGFSLSLSYFLSPSLLVSLFLNEKGNKEKRKNILRKKRRHHQCNERFHSFIRHKVVFLSYFSFFSLFLSVHSSLILLLPNTFPFLPF